MRPLRFARALAVFALLVPRVALADPSSTTIDQGYELGEMQQPRTVAMAGAQNAWGGSTTGLMVNPANLTLIRVYHLEGLAAFAPEARRQSFGGAVVDSSRPLAGGFAGTWSQMDSDGIRRTWADLRLGLGYTISDRLSLGLTGRYLRVGQSVSAGPLGASLASDGTRGEPIFSQFTFDAGLGLQISEQFRLGLTGKNLTVPGTALAPTAVAAGFGWSNQTVTIEGDGQVDFTTAQTARMRAMLGAEVFLIDRFPIRAGYRYDDILKTHAITGGAGYVERKFSIDAAVRRDVVGDRPATMLVLGVRLFIDAVGAGTNAPETGSDM